MLYINNADSPYSEQRVTLGTSNYIIELKFNSRNEGWYLNLLSSDGQTSLVTGLRLKPNQIITNRYLVEDFEGALACLRTKNDYSELSKDNLGRDKVYRIVWFNESELENLGAEDVVQLS